MRRAAGRGLTWLLVPVLAAGVLAPGCTKAESPPPGGKGENMAEPQTPPFGLTEAGLGEVEIVYGFQSTKTGGGKQEIVIAGDGKVELLMTRTLDADPIVQEGKLPPGILMGLLGVVEDARFFALDEHYPTDGPSRGGWYLTVVLPDRRLRVVVEGTEPPAFGRVAGAVKLAAALALPDALNHRFFPNL